LCVYVYSEATVGTVMPYFKHMKCLESEGSVIADAYLTADV
jgi:hypothetical protein